MPLYGQVEFGDARASDHPQWETGEEKVVFTTQVLRGDHKGDVLVEVWAEPVGDLDGTEVLETELQIIEGVAQFGNQLAGQLFDVLLRPGWHTISAFSRLRSERRRWFASSWEPIPC